MGRESTVVWAALKPELVKHRLHHQRLEDKLTPGIPDVNIHFPRGDVWVEMKFVAEVPRALNGLIEIGLRPEQFIWLRDADKAGRSCYLLAKVGVGWYVWDDAGSWELAKRNSPWRPLRSKAHQFTSIAAVVHWLANAC